MRSLFVAAALVSAAAVASPWDIAPPPRGQWVLDRTGKVSGSVIANVNTIASALDSSGAGQLGVLITDTTSGTNPRDFATGVFNSWGVGHHGANDGILLFFAVGDRKSEIVLGDGSKVKSYQTDVVMRDDVVANMKRGSLDEAVLQASKALVDLMRTANGLPAMPSPNDNTGLGGDTYVTPMNPAGNRDEVLAAYAEGSKAFPERSPRTWVVDVNDVLTPSQRAQLDVSASDIYSSNQGRIFFLVVKSTASYPTVHQLGERLMRQVQPLSKTPVGIVVLDVGTSSATIELPMPITTAWDRQQVEAAEAEIRATFFSDRVAALLGGKRFVQTALTTGIPPRPMSDVLSAGYQRNKSTFMFGGVLGAIVGLFGLKRWNRKRVRVCTTCKNPRQLLGDAAEDKHLDQGQLTEESVGSVDYDVWWCGRCSDVLVLRYGAIFSSYSKCTSCGSKTLRSSCTTITAATEWSGGSERIDETCANCSYKNSYTRATARLQSSSSSDSSWSSSSSGSSFGGGSSSGGGSSGSW